MGPVASHRRGWPSPRAGSSISRALAGAAFGRLSGKTGSDPKNPSRLVRGRASLRASGRLAIRRRQSRSQERVSPGRRLLERHRRLRHRFPIRPLRRNRPSQPDRAGARLALRDAVDRRRADPDGLRAGAGGEAAKTPRLAGGRTRLCRNRRQLFSRGPDPAITGNRAGDPDRDKRPRRQTFGDRRGRSRDNGSVRGPRLLRPQGRGGPGELRTRPREDGRFRLVRNSGAPASVALEDAPTPGSGIGVSPFFSSRF